MNVLTVLLILLLGYRINSHVDEKTYRLKRSVGWESYAILAIDGVISLSIAFFCLIFLYIVALLLGSLVGSSILNLSLFETHVSKVLEDEYIKCLFIFMVLVASATVNEIRLNVLNSEPNLSALKKLDGMMSIVITALENSSYLKISLSSGKVYIGILLKEDFKSGPDETLIILPMLSGYRDKENLNMHLDCNYLDVYIRHGIVEIQSEGISHHPELAETASMLIPVSEIESIAFFDINMHKDFKFGEDAVKRFRVSQTLEPDSSIEFDISNYLNRDS